MEMGGGFTIRLAEPADADAVEAAFLPQRLALQTAFGQTDFQLVIEMSLYSFVALNSDNKLVAFSSINDTPSIPGSVPTRKIQDARVWARHEASDLGFLMDSLLWLEVCAVCSMSEKEGFHIFRSFIRAVFTLCPEIQVVLHPSPAQYPVFPQLLKSMSRSADFNLIICACLRSTVLPTMKVRRAEEEDYDDLLPVIERAQQRGCPLAQVPEIAIPSRPYAVARLIAAQNEDNIVFVAEVDDKLVGMMAITAAISHDYCFNFNLDDFYGLIGKEVRRFEVPLEADGDAVPEGDISQDSAASKSVASPAEGARPSIVAVAHEVIDPAATHSQPPNVVLETKILELDESQGVLNPENMSALEEIKEEISKEQALKFRVVEVEVPSKVTNAFQISMLCIEEEFENQGIDFIAAAFKQDKRDYCLVGYPYTSRLHPLLHLFTRVSCRPSRRIIRDDLPATCMMTDDPPDPKISSLCLYLLHRDSLSPGFEVRPSKSRDADALVVFLEDFKDCKSIIDLIEHPRKGCLTIVAVLSAQIVGLAMIEENVPAAALSSQFHIKSLINIEHHPAENQACITLFSLSPIFRHRRRMFLREIMRQTDKTLLYCPVFPEQELPDVIEDLLLVPARQHVHMSPVVMWGRNPETLGPNRRATLRRGSTSASFSPRGLFSGFDCALYLTTHRLTCRYRVVVNSRILVAGGSRTAEAFLHKLISYPQMHFTNLTLVSPSGFLGFSSPAASILDIESGPARAFIKLGIDCQVGLKQARVIDLDRTAQTVLLSNDEVLTYDILILAVGLQDQTRSRLQLSTLKDVVRADEFFFRLDKITGSLEKLKVPREALPEGEGFVVVYGATLEAFYVVQLLLSKGVKGSNIVLAHPEPKLTSSYFHGDANVLSSLLEELSWTQASIKSGMKLVGVSLNDAGNLKNVVFEGSKAQANDEEDEEDEYNLEQPCCLLITCDRKQVDVPLFYAMRRENIIFDGRVVVDGKFQTNDPFIFAAGSACKFSRRCGKLPKLETFCSIEVGEALTASMISKFHTHLPDAGKLWPSIMPLLPNASQGHDETLWPTPSTPILGRPKCTGGVLPGGTQFFCIVLPSCHKKNWDSLQIQSLLTKYESFYARMDILESKQLARVLYAGKVRTDSWKFQQIVGLPVSLLNNLPKRYSEGAVNDIIGFILQPWSAVLFHDEFLPFYTRLSLEIVETSKNHPKGAQISSETFDKLDPELAGAISVLVKKELLKFIEDRQLELPMYKLPRKRTDVRLLLPKVITSNDFEVQEKKKQAAAAVAATTSAALIAATDLVKTAFEQLITKAEEEEQDRATVKQIVGELVQGMEDLKPVLLSLKGEGYMGPTVDNLLQQIDRTMLSISVWDESLEPAEAGTEEDIKSAIEEMIRLLEQTSPVLLSLNELD